ncbi:MAG TPA: hypothetical protein VIM62_00185 [Acidobacteriaceae bacterium]
MPKYDITKSLDPLNTLLANTTNPRHQYLLKAYKRHLYLEMSGRYDEVIVDDMMVENPVYNLHALGFNTVISGRDNVRNLYKFWADTNQCVFFGENLQVAVADNFIALTVTAHQQVWGGSILSSKALGVLPKGLSSEILLEMLKLKGIKPDPNHMYLYTNFEETLWPYDDRGRLLREDIFEPDPKNAVITKLEPEDVVTTAQAAQLLAPLIEPLPNFDEYVLGKKAS